MTSNVICKVIILLCCSVCVASVHSPGNFFFGNQTGWNLAWKVCHENQTRLPNVKVSESGLELADTVHRELNECFWIGALYELTNYTCNYFS
ncbi:hypothetical protein CHS0354_003838 [Potamilus streckersoni]|uniref:C-type lectin domain-containing protein n=1 Tax=Potamilus streckersoni TaxID=2493646 RepID=A0AAE0VUJ6_9BIVA|nr:hypothetical protein CHS0354_003838 [Potamilus streckersoni]